MHACDLMRIEVVRHMLRDDRTDINTKDINGHTALMLACHYDRTCIVELLINAASIKINERDNKGYTALMYAANNNSYKLLKNRFPNNR